ncbi:hypothetical protein JAAARDRAFT_691295 [Jaapia argillacea MUCL 33604]|uniref:Uncharacterized protein n=1 Tax=Jaapia argillacea MUCL 33604 TaxID=933084 RepID=A0A067PQR6_9AGAM|nr:hypothetical protein JAAARDRAFT_691295 [Jaapia argillacea MUCL 33604]
MCFENVMCPNYPNHCWPGYSHTRLDFANMFPATPLHMVSNHTHLAYHPSQQVQHYSPFVPPPVPNYYPSPCWPTPPPVAPPPTSSPFQGYLRYEHHYYDYGRDMSSQWLTKPTSPSLDYQPYQSRRYETRHHYQDPDPTPQAPPPAQSSHHGWLTCAGIQQPPPNRHRSVGVSTEFDVNYGSQGSQTMANPPVPHLLQTPYRDVGVGTEADVNYHSQGSQTLANPPVVPHVSYRSVGVGNEADVVGQRYRSQGSQTPRARRSRARGGVQYADASSSPHSHHGGSGRHQSSSATQTAC